MSLPPITAKTIETVTGYSHPCRQCSGHGYFLVAEDATSASQIVKEVCWACDGTGKTK